MEMSFSALYIYQEWCFWKLKQSNWQQAHECDQFTCSQPSATEHLDCGLPRKFFHFVSVFQMPFGKHWPMCHGSKINFLVYLPVVGKLKKFTGQNIFQPAMHMIKINTNKRAGSICRVPAANAAAQYIGVAVLKSQSLLTPLTVKRHFSVNFILIVLPLCSSFFLLGWSTLAMYGHILADSFAVSAKFSSVVPGLIK